MHAKIGADHHFSRSISGFPVFCAGASAPTNIIKHHSIDLNVPIGCGGVPVYPDDIIVGDIDGVVVIPRQIAEEVAADAAEQERMEEFILDKIQNGARLAGTYPPDDGTRAALFFQSAPRSVRPSPRSRRHGHQSIWRRSAPQLQSPHPGTLIQRRGKAANGQSSEF